MIWFMYEGSLLPKYIQNGQKDSFLMAFPAASALGSISRFRGCPLCATLVVGRQPSPSPAGMPWLGLAAPMTWPLAGICSTTHRWQVCRARENLGGSQRVQLGRSSKSHTRWFSWDQKPRSASCTPEVDLWDQEIWLLCRGLCDHRSLYHALSIHCGPCWSSGPTTCWISHPGGRHLCTAEFSIPP